MTAKSHAPIPETPKECPYHNARRKKLRYGALSSVDLLCGFCRYRNELNNFKIPLKKLKVPKEGSPDYNDQFTHFLTWASIWSKIQIYDITNLIDKGWICEEI